MTDRANGKREDVQQGPTPCELDETLAADLDKVPTVGVPTSPGPPRVFGRYRIQRVLGGGGMGTVYLAHDTQLDRDIALKIPKFRTNEQRDVVQRFYREARAMAALRHQNLCTVHDVGEIDGIHYLTMAYIHGQSLSQLTPSGRFYPNRTAAAVVRKLAVALHQAHRAGVVHRDLKPANIIIDQTSQPVVVDFGLAFHHGAGEGQPDGTPVIAGTPAYMSPEQVEGQLEAIGPASDIYSLGVILYRMLAGRLPYHGSLQSVLAQILNETPAHPSSFNSQIDPVLEALCLQAMAKDPQQRFASMEEMAKDLLNYLKATAADASTSVAVSKPSGDRSRPLVSTEMAILCPVCATRIDAASETIGKEVQCPQCHTPIALRSHGAVSTDHAPVAQDEGDFYQLAEPVERLSVPLSEFEPSTESDTASSAERTTTSVGSDEERIAGEAGDRAVAQVWQWLQPVRSQFGSFVRTASDTGFVLRWFGTSGLFFLCLPLAIYLVSDLFASSLSSSNAAIFVVAPVVAVLAVLTAGQCLAVFRACVDSESPDTVRLKLGFSANLRTCPYVLVPLLLALIPGLAGGWLLRTIGAADFLQFLAVTISLFGLFPVFFLSSIGAQSVFSPISLLIWRSIKREAHAWRVFFAVSGLLVIVVSSIVVITVWHPRLLTFFAAPAFSALTLFYFQWIGQLARTCCSTPR